MRIMEPLARLVAKRRSDGILFSEALADEGASEAKPSFG
jgi:hypothetical protein